MIKWYLSYSLVPKYFNLYCKKSNLISQTMYDCFSVFVLFCYSSLFPNWINRKKQPHIIALSSLIVIQAKCNCTTIPNRKKEIFPTPTEKTLFVLWQWGENHSSNVCSIIMRGILPSVYLHYNPPHANLFARMRWPARHCLGILHLYPLSLTPLLRQKPNLTIIFKIHFSLLMTKGNNIFQCTCRTNLMFLLLNRPNLHIY